MTTIGQNGEKQPQKMELVPDKGKRYEVKEGDSVEYVKNKGTAAQKAAASIFDYDGDGRYDSIEAWDFNRYRITADTIKGEVRLYGKDEPKNAKPSKVVNIAEEEKDYKERTAKFQKLEQTLTRYGIDVDMARRVGIDDCEVKTLVGGNSVLVLKAPDFVLELPIDKDFDPKQIEIYQGGEGCPGVRFDNVNGTLKCMEENLKYGNYFTFGGNSKVTVIGKDGVPDIVSIEDSATVTFATKDYADSIEDRTRKPDNKEEGPYKVTNLKPGTTTVQGAGNQKEKTKGA